MMKKKNNLKSIIIVVFCACLCVGYYYYLTQKNSGKEDVLTDAEMIISRDLNKSYPKTAREVVKFYNQILKCYYEQGYSQEQLEQIAEQARELMDQELREKNPQDVYLEALQADISAYDKKEQTISSIRLEGVNEIEYKTVKGSECAYVDVDYYLKGKDGSQRASQTYILRKDADSKWRILGFYQE
ncbi:DUF6715 family protein [Lachnospiraceae bacterium 45-W7]